MTDSEPILTVNVRRIKAPPFYDFSIDKHPDNDNEVNALLTFMLVSLQKTIYDVNGMKPAKYADEVN